MRFAQVILAGLTVIGGIVMVMCSLYIDPEGVIDPTVLVAFGEALTFAGAVIGVDYHYKHKTLSSMGSKNKSIVKPGASSRQTGRAASA